MQYKEIPRKLILSKRLSQCLNPALPTGVHQRALDVYSHILAVLGVRYYPIILDCNSEPLCRPRALGEIYIFGRLACSPSLNTQRYQSKYYPKLWLDADMSNAGYSPFYLVSMTRIISHYKEPCDLL